MQKGHFIHNAKNVFYYFHSVCIIIKKYVKLAIVCETWLHLYNPENKRDSMQWKHLSSPTPRKFKVTVAADKIMCSIFWDADGVFLIDYMPHKATTNGSYYANLFQKL